MDNENRNAGSRLFMCLLLFLAIFALMQFARSGYGQGQSDYTQEAFEEDLAAEKVAAVAITPNQETPTGYAEVSLKDGTDEILYATDVTRI